ncbi:MAG: PEP-CTERM sorting domain-containing protein [Candidatus Vogelbacteria bacterium]|nr:PEP-CTERM sorting domain-containing protein [Candidatus Vogelbacteria bacterium]
MTTEPSPDGDYINYIFNPELSLYGNGSSKLYQFPDTPPLWSNFYSNVYVEGGMVTNISTDIERNIWSGDGAPPPWLSDLRLNFYASGVITAGNFTIVPEPASLALLSAGGVAMIYRKRRLSRLRLNPIG